MTSGKKRFHIRLVDRFDSGSTFVRWRIFYVKVDFDLEVDSRPGLLHALVFSTLQTTS